MNSLEAAEIRSLSHTLAWTRELGVTKALGRLAKLGDQEPLYAASVILAVAGAARRDRKLVAAAIRVGAAVAVSDVLKSLTKKLIKRSRPRAVFAGHDYRREGGGSDSKDEQSFPSGHVAATLAATRALARIYPETTLAGLATVVALGGIRIAEGEHWPSDILAGATIGQIAEVMSAPALGLLLSRLALEGRGRP